jgi:hypothetical protein
MRHRLVIAAAAAALAVPALAAGPLQVTSRILVERRVAAADGTTRLVAAPRDRAAPGNRLIVELAYRNTGTRPIGDLVLADPVPAALAYRAPAEGTPAPELSVDGTRFASLADLVVALPGGGRRAARPDDVVAVRWRLPAALAAGAGGTLSFRAVLR